MEDELSSGESVFLIFGYRRQLADKLNQTFTCLSNTLASLEYASFSDSLPPPKKQHINFYSHL